MYNYQTVCHSNLLKVLTGRQKEIISRRFGLRGKRETLEAIGRGYGVTRERVRQIEEDGLSRLAKADAPAVRSIFQNFIAYLKNNGSLKREDLMLEELGGRQFKNHVLFLLTLGKDFKRFKETKDSHAFWATDDKSLEAAQRTIRDFIAELEENGQPSPLLANTPISHIEISKNILKGEDGLYGLRDWPEVNPRGIKDKAFIVLKKEQRPLHFSHIASLVKANVQTVHNELIKDQRFVLVGRGTYALRAWGYEPGVVREVIARVIKDSPAALATDNIIEKVLAQRLVKPNTILLNLQNKKYFLKNSEGKYTIREV
jgi:hypothetical protein